MQKMVGVDSPDYGPVLASTVYRDGDTIPVSRFIQPKIEAEIVFVLGERLVGPGVTVPTRAAAIAGAVAAMEIVDSRIADWRIKLADTVADLASNGAIATSSRVVPIDGLDPRLVGMTLTRNGELVDTGAGAAALGDPVAVVAWLANVLGARRRRARARPPDHDRGAARRRADDAGDVFRAEFDRLGPITVRGWGTDQMPRLRVRGEAPKAVADRTAIDPLPRRARPRHRLRRPAGAARRGRARSSAGSSASPAGPSRRRSAWTARSTASWRGRTRSTSASRSTRPR